MLSERYSSFFLSDGQTWGKVPSHGWLTILWMDVELVFSKGVLRIAVSECESNPAPLRPHWSSFAVHQIAPSKVKIRLCVINRELRVDRE